MALSDEAHELELYIDNEGSLYPMKKQIARNLAGKHKAGKYDRSKAPAAWMYLVERGAKKYAQEFAEAKAWHTIFPTACRRELAERYARWFESVKFSESEV